MRGHDPAAAAAAAATVDACSLTSFDQFLLQKSCVIVSTIYTATQRML